MKTIKGMRWTVHSPIKSPVMYILSIFPGRKNSTNPSLHVSIGLISDRFLKFFFLNFLNTYCAWKNSDLLCDTPSNWRSITGWTENRIGRVFGREKLQTFFKHSDEFTYNSARVLTPPMLTSINKDASRSIVVVADVCAPEKRC